MRKKFDYFDAFIQMSQMAVDYSELLLKYFKKNLEIKKDPEKEVNVEHARERFYEAHEIETKSDTIRHNLIVALNEDFVTPIEREDILELTDELDNMVDDLDSILMRMYMYNVHYVTEESLEMLKVVQRATLKVNEACKEFKNFKKSKELPKLIVQISDVEEEGDRLYLHAMHDNFARAKEAAEFSDVMGVSTLLSSLEKCCDACENVADTMTSVIVKNS